MDYQGILALIEEAEMILRCNVPQPNKVVTAKIRRLALDIDALVEGRGAISQKCVALIETSEIAYAPRSRRRCTRAAALHDATSQLVGMKIALRQSRPDKWPPTKSKLDPRRDASAPEK